MIRAVSYADILNASNAKELLHEYALECSIPGLGYASPQADLYALLEKSGGFQAFGVYDDETLVGFAAVLVYVLPHYGHKIAATESIFISKANRKSGASDYLMTVIEEYARERGCIGFLYSAPKGSQFDHVLSAMKKVNHTNNVYLRSLL